MILHKDTDRYAREIENLLFEGELVEQGYGMDNEFVCLTNKRIFFVDKFFQSEETDIVSIPYKKIVAININQQRDKDIIKTNKIEVVTYRKVYKFEFEKDVNVVAFYRALSKYVCES